MSGMTMARRHRFTFLALLVLALVMVGVILAFHFQPHEPLAKNVEVDRIVVEKSERRMMPLNDGNVLKSYRISLGGDPVGHKVQEGDGRTPEGIYHIVSRNPVSSYHRSPRISYPDADDRALAVGKGVSPGGDIVIHGLRNGFGWLGRLHRLVDWTQGCIAVTDEEMIEIWNAVPDKTVIKIRP